MSTIEKLSIRGVRSFGSDTEDEQKITFTSPLTLILGENGCGKTTVIECIKYALTGELPPGCNKGQSFVHDPKIFNYSECLGQVKLQIKNVRDDKLVVTRSMRSTVGKGNAMKFATLDSTVHTIIGGKAESISKRCLDVNVEIINAMGVSKAIINNVLFCHQEDSSWPLDDGKKLKEKFDAIFGTTDYNKAVDKFMKLRKTHVDKLKQKEADLKILIHIKKDAESKNFNLENTKQKLEKSQIAHGNCDAEMQPIKERLQKLMTVEMEIGKLMARKVEEQTKIKNNKENQKNLENKIKKKFDGSLDMLENKISEFKNGMTERENNVRRNEESLNGIIKQENRIQSQMSEMDRNRTKLILQRQQEQDFLSQRAKLLQDLCDRLLISCNSDLENTDANSQEIQKLILEISVAFKREDEQLNELSRSHDKIDLEQQTGIDKLREKRATVESDISSKRKQMQTLKIDQEKNKREIDNVEKSAQELRKTTAEIIKLSKCYDEYCGNINFEETKQKISEKRAKRNELQEQLDKVDEQVTFLSSISKITAEISLKENQLELREAEARKVKNKHSDNLKRLLNNETIESNFKRRIQTIYQNMQREINDLNKQINRNQGSIIELQLMRKNQKDELNRMERDVHESEEKIYEQCHSTPFVEVLERVKENVSKHQLDHGAYKSAEVLYKKYLKKMEDKPCCPLCHKDMSAPEVGDLTAELIDEIRHLPENIQKTERTLKTETRKYEALLAIQPLTEKLEKLKVDIPKLRQNLKQTEEKLSNAIADSETFEMTLAEPKSNLELANSMSGDMSLLDEALKDIAKIQQELQTLKSKLPTRMAPLSMEETQLQRATVVAELKKESVEYDNLQNKYDRDVEMKNDLREKLNTKKDKQIKLQEGVQALSQMKTRQQEISQQIELLLAGVSTLEAELEPLKVDLKLALDAKQKLKDENKKAYNSAATRLNDMKKVDGEIKRCSKELQTLSQFNLIEEIERLKKSMEKLMADQKEKKAENQQMAKLIEQLNKEILGGESIMRDLNDNKELIETKNQLCILEARLEKIVDDMGDLDFSSVDREKDTLLKKREKIMEKRAEYDGQIGELKSQMKIIESELNQPKYKSALQNYRSTFIDVAVTKKLIDDLGRYRVALEWALLKFHSEKMEKINRLVRELWRSIYRGNDIDYIQIKTDEMKSTALDKKRSYDYRVVQSKNDIELDMRGRCSAGQRVLASLIIRIALAETFSNNCGILALDEPTTNLDRNNIKSLCEELNKIVEERSTNSNFMLLVITHDEEFITTLGNVSTYYKLSRGNTGKSLIQKVRLC